MKTLSAAILAGSLAALGGVEAAAAEPPAVVLTAAQVNAQIVGHKVEAIDESGSMAWYYRKGGVYDADDGRNSRGGVYVVRPDGRLCWTELSGIKGCFQYYRQRGVLHARRADPDNRFEIGPVKVGPLD